ncbi:hypothetical protein K2X33_02445 [bacterium]|nr:hypothetical protein [bacterium]
MRYEILIDAGETANKCTIKPLSGRPDFRLFKVWGEGPLGPFSAPLLLHHEGECLSTLREGFQEVPAIAAVDCVWRRLPRLLKRMAWEQDQPAVRARIPEGFITAYPRVGQPEQDPDGGLATIEALFIAAALVGNWDVTLLSKYYFGRAFVEKNARRFLELGVAQAGNPETLPPVFQSERSSQSRRWNRGRAPKV